jgi:hypothetical protein
MEMTKKRITTVHVIAMIFCWLLGSRAESPAARERFAPSSTNPSSATPTHARLSASSMISRYGMHSTARVQHPFERIGPLKRLSAKDGEPGPHRTLSARKLRAAAAPYRGLACIFHFGGCADDGAVSAGGAGDGAGLLNTASSIFGLISILSVTRFCLISVPGLPWSIRKGYFKPWTSR